MSNRKVIAILVAASLVGALAIAGFYWYRGTRYVLTEDARVSGSPIVASAQTLGRITAMSAAVGRRVAAGEVLARLDDATLLAQEHQAEAGVEAAAQGVVLAQATLDQAETSLSRAEVQFRDQIIPAVAYHDAQVAKAQAKAGYGLALAQKRLAETRLAEVRTYIAQTIVASPVDGVVAKQWRAVGDVVAPTQPIYTLFDLHRVWVTAMIKETEVKQLSVGDPATFTVDSLPGRTFRGRVETIEPGTAAALASSGGWSADTTNFDKKTQRIPVRIAIDRSELDDPAPSPAGGGAPGGSAADPSPRSGGRLVPGMSAEVRISIAR